MRETWKACGHARSEAINNIRERGDTAFADWIEAELHRMGYEGEIAMPAKRGGVWHFWCRDCTHMLFEMAQ